MSTHRLLSLSAFVVPLLIPIAVPRADAQPCDLFQTVPDGRIRGPFTISTGTNDVGMRFQGVVGKSYSVEGLVTTAPYNAGTLSVSWGGAGVNCPTGNFGGIRRTDVIDPAADTSVVAFVRASFTAPSTNVYMFRIGNDSGTPVSVQVSVSETTLYSTAWSTIANYNTYYSLQNTTRSTCSGTLTLFNTGGSVADTQALSIPSGATGSTNTASMATPRGSAGTASFTHDCPPGAFLAEAAIADFSISPTPYFQFVRFDGTRDAATH